MASPASPRHGIQHHHRLSSASSAASQRPHPYRSAQRSHRSSESLEETETSELVRDPPHDLDVRSPRARRKRKPVFASMSMSDVNSNLGCGTGSGRNQVDSFADPSVKATTGAGSSFASAGTEEALRGASTLLPAFEELAPSYKPRSRTRTFDVDPSSFSPATPLSAGSSNRLLFSNDSIIDLSGPDTPIASPTPSPTKSSSSAISPECLTSRFKRRRSSSLFDSLRTRDLLSTSKSQRISADDRLPACLPTGASTSSRAVAEAEESINRSPVPSPPSSPTKYGATPIKKSRGVKSLSCLRERQRERRQIFRRAVSALDYNRPGSSTNLAEVEDDADEMEEDQSMDAEQSAGDDDDDNIQLRIAETLASNARKLEAVSSPRTPHNDNLRRSALFGCSTDDAAKLLPLRRHSLIDVTSPNDSPIAMILLAGFSVPSELEMDEGFFRNSLAEDDPLLRVARRSEADNAGINAIQESGLRLPESEDEDIHMQPPHVESAPTANLRYFSHITLPPDSPELEATELPVFVESDSVKENMPVSQPEKLSPMKPLASGAAYDKAASQLTVNTTTPTTGVRDTTTEERGRLRSKSIVMAGSERGATGCESPSVLHDITQLMI